MSRAIEFLPETSLYTSFSLYVKREPNTKINKNKVFENELLMR
jgi:hypothetical protein